MGNILEGQWDRTAANKCEGTMYYNNGDKITCTWVNGKPSGKGIKQLADGSRVECICINGIFVGTGKNLPSVS